MAEKKRLANIELLRVIAMAMVVTMHFIRESGMLLDASDTGSASFPVLFFHLLESFCIVAVNAYVFISGYYGSESDFKPKKAVSFLCRIWFYSLLIPLVLTCFKIPTMAKEQGIYGLVQYVLPVESDTYFFASAYFLLMLFMPVLNAAVKLLEKRQFQFVLSGLLLLFCGVKSICPVALPLDKYGYDFAWFLCVYLTAAYLKKYGGGLFEKKGREIYAGSCFMIFAMTIALWYALKPLPFLKYYFTVPFHYNFVLCLTGAIGLFFGFGRLTIKEGKAAGLIRKAGKYSFGVYLFHEHPDIRHRWYPFVRSLVAKISGLSRNGAGFAQPEGFAVLLAELILSILLLFAAGFFAEYVRNLLFKGRRDYAGKN